MHSVQEPVDDRNLGMQVLGGLLPVGLVLVVHLMAEGLALGIHGNHKILRLILPDEAHNRVEEAVDGRDVVPLLILEGVVHESEI